MKYTVEWAVRCVVNLITAANPSKTQRCFIVQPKITRVAKTMLVSDLIHVFSRLDVIVNGWRAGKSDIRKWTIWNGLSASELPVEKNTKYERTIKTARGQR